jgi:AhpD family alkylhydroperoxidase
MDEKTKTLISLGASVAANCIPCIEHYYAKADAAGIHSVEIKAAVEIAEKVKNGAGIATKSCIYDIMNDSAPKTHTGKCGNQTPCCG